MAGFGPEEGAKLCFARHEASNAPGERRQARPGPLHKRAKRARKGWPGLPERAGVVHFAAASGASSSGSARTSWAMEFALK